jgi:transcriptional regulator with XRE-family HTH domain
MAQEDDYRQNFRENLKAIRINFGYTQADLSLRANYDTTYVGKLERGKSVPSIETVKRMGEALGIDPLMLLSPKLAHLNLLSEAPSSELKALPFNPLDIEIMDSLPYPMGIVTPQGTPVYINDTFAEATGISRDDIEQQHLVELPFWSFTDGETGEIEEAISTFDDTADEIVFEISVDGSGEEPLKLCFYPSPKDRKPGDRGMWIFELRGQKPGSIPFPITVTALNRMK